MFTWRRCGFGLAVMWMASRNNHVDGHEANPYADGDVGHIEGGPVVNHYPIAENAVNYRVHRPHPAGTVLNEIDNSGSHYSIHQIAQGTAEYQRQTPQKRPLMLIELSIEREDEEYCKNADDDEKRASHGIGCIMKQSPRAALVVGKREPEVIFDDGDARLVWRRT